MGTDLADGCPVVKLQARFHPSGQPSDRYLVVVHITWPDPPADPRPRVEPCAALTLTPAPATVLSTLRLLVTTSSQSMEQLESMRNRYWSFVRTTDALS